MSKFMGTDGPWVALNGLSSGREVVGRKPRGGDYVVARCGGKDREHNARLIAAAPELLEEHEEWSALIGSVYVMLLQGDAEGALSLIHESEVIDFSKGAPLAVSTTIAKALGEDQ